MVTLKKSFEIKNYYDTLLNDAKEVLLSNDVLNRVQDHLYSKVSPEMEDEHRIIPKEYDIDCTIETLIKFTLNLVTHIEDLTVAISDAKRYAATDLDSTVTVNKYKRYLIECLNLMCRKKPTTTQSKGNVQKFNEQGDPVMCSYDIVETVELEFDRDSVRRMISRLRTEADENSTDIDLVQLETKVDYEPFCDIGDPLDVAIKKMQCFPVAS